MREPLDDRQAKPGPAAAVIAIDARKAVEQMRLAADRQARALIEHAERQTIRRAAPLDHDVGIGRREFGGIAEQVDQHVMQHPRVGLDQRQRRRHVEHQPVPRELGAQVARGGGDRVGQVGRLALDDERARLDPCHLDQIVEHAPQPPRLALERRAGGGGAVRDSELVGRRDDRGQRRLEIVPDRREQRRAQIVALLERIDLARLRLELEPFMRERGLADERREQHALVGGDRIAALARDSQHAEHAQSGLERMELPLARGQRAAVAPGHLAAVERPFGGGGVDRAQLDHRRCRGDRDVAAVAVGEQNRRDAEQRRNLLARRGRRAIFVGHAGKPLAEGGERGILGRGARADIGFAPHLSRQLARHHRDDDEHGECHDIVRIGDRQRVERRKEEEIVGERRADARDQRRAQAIKCRGRDDREQIQQVDRIGADQRQQQLRQRGAGGDEGEADRAAPRQDRARRRRFATRLAGLRDGDDVDRHAVERAHQPIDHRAVA